VVFATQKSLIFFIFTDDFAISTKSLLCLTKHWIWLSKFTC